MAFFKKSGEEFYFSCFYADDGDGAYSGVFHRLDARNAQRLAAVYRATSILAIALCAGLLLLLAAAAQGVQVPLELMLAVFIVDSALILPAALLVAISKKTTLSKQPMQLEVARSAHVYVTAGLIPFNYCVAITIAGVSSPLLSLFIVASIAIVAACAWRLRQLQRD
ncbi:MAG: hypothetical protein ACXW2U_01340 [Telluria sp.]